MSVLLAIMTPIAQASEDPEVWTLDQIVNRAVSDNPDTRVAAQRLRVTEAELQEADSAFWPQLQFQTGYQWTNIPMLAFGAILNQRVFDPTTDFNAVPSMDNLNMRGTVTMPLFAGGANVARHDAAEAQQTVLTHQRTVVRNSVSFAATRAYFTVQKTAAFVSAAQAALHSYEENVVVARRRYEAGTLLKADLLDVEVRLARAKEDLVRSRNAEALAKRALLNLIGSTAEDIVLVSDERVTPLDEGQAPQQRPELQALAAQEEALSAMRRAERAGYLPRLDAMATVNFDHGFKEDGNKLSYLAGLMLSWSLWDGMRTVSRMEKVAANQAILSEQERKLRLAIDLEIEQAKIRLREATERLEVIEQSIAQAEESASLTRSRFGQGLALSTQLIDAETAITALRVRQAEALADQQIATAAVRLALGHSQLD